MKRNTTINISFKLDKAESVASKKEEEKKQVSVNMDEL